MRMQSFLITNEIQSLNQMCFFEDISNVVEFVLAHSEHILVSEKKH